MRAAVAPAEAGLPPDPHHLPGHPESEVGDVAQFPPGAVAAGLLVLVAQGQESLQVDPAEADLAGRGIVVDGFLLESVDLHLRSSDPPGNPEDAAVHFPPLVDRSDVLPGIGKFEVRGCKDRESEEKKRQNQTGFRHAHTPIRS